jgi:hypothetical protein
VNATNPTSIDKARTVDDVIGGHFVNGTWVPNCPDADLALRKAISKSIANLPSNHDDVRDELYAEIRSKLVIHLGKYKRKPRGVLKIRNKKFLRSPNRLGWLSLFAQNTAKGWIADRVRRAIGDKRVKVALCDKHIPAETFSREQERLRQETLTAGSQHFDVHQFAGRKCKPLIDENPRDAFGPREPVEMQSLDIQDAERLALIRAEVATLPLYDREFFEGYVSTWHERGIRHTPAERKRFERLCKRVREACVTFP